MLYNNFVNINVDNLNSNIDYIKNNYNYKYYILDVTNNAFNHGMYIINYLNNKIDYSYTTSFNDCVLIRKYTKDIPIIYSGLITKENIFDLIINNVIVVIKDKYIFKDIVNENIKDNLNVILNIDLDKYNGINSKYDILDILELIKDNKYINVTGIKAKVSEDNYDDFKYVISPLKDLQLIILNDENDKNKIKLSNSIKLDYSIYGFNNVKKNLFKKECLYLKQIFTLNSRVVNIAKEKKNKKDIIIGVISFGFNNGLASLRFFCENFFQVSFFSFVFVSMFISCSVTFAIQDI